MQTQSCLKTLCSLRLLAPLLLCFTTALQGVTHNITIADDFDDLPDPIPAGDEIIIADGTYNEVGRTLNAAGTLANPVIMRAANPGNVFFSGDDFQFSLKGSHMVISGLAFDGDTAAGGARSSGIFRFFPDSSNIILRDCLFRNFDTGVDMDNGATWLQINGYRHTVEYCSFIGKKYEDAIINIIPPEDDPDEIPDLATKDVPRHHLIRYCYFADRTFTSEDNGYESIRIGESKYQMYNMANIVEHCVFKRAIYGPNISTAEPEVITSKSRNNIYRFNTFRENKGGLVLRHGDDNVIDGNFFFGIPKPAVPVTPPEGEVEIEKMSAGIRIIGLRHIIRNNYFEDIHGIGLRAPICLMKGSGEFSEDSTSNGYESPGNARIFHNTITNCEQPFALGSTTSSSGNTAPNNVEIRNNAVQSESDNGAVIDFNNSNGWTIDEITFSDNHAYHPSGTYGTVPASGFTTGTAVNLALDVGLGYQIPQVGSPLINAAAATTPATYNDVRSMLRTGPANDVGNYDSESTGSSYNRPLVKADVGPVFDGRTDTNRVPTLTEWPVDQSAFELDSISLSVTVDSALAVTYQWNKDEVAIPGATSSTYSIPSVALADAGFYTVEVINTSGRSISFPAELTVAPSVPVIVTEPVSISVDYDDPASFSVTAVGNGVSSYQWRKDGNPIGGATSDTFSIANAQTADAADYSVVITNSFGSTTSADATLTVAPPFPVITMQPVSKLTSLGATVQFSVAADGVTPFTYEWRKDGAPIPMSDSDTLEITNVQASDEADYSVVVTNSFGNATSQDAALSLSTGTLIVNDDFSDLDRSKTGDDDADWWSTNSTSGNSVEIDANGLGMVTGSSGRGIHGTFAPQTLVVGEQLVVTFNFTTPNTIGNNKGSAFRVALADFNNSGLAADLSSSSSSVNPLYQLLPAYMADFDIATGSEDVSIRKHDSPNSSGRFLGTTGEWTSMGSSDDNGYTFAPNTAYVGVFTVSRTGADTIDVFSSISLSGGALMDSHTETDASDIANNFGMVGFWANSNTFGDTTSSDPDNGVTFTNITVEVGAIPSNSPLEDWRFTHFGTTEGTGDAANDFDFDVDGLENLVEYALGLNPTVPDSEGALTPAKTDVDGDDYLTLTFTRDLTATGVNLSILAGDDFSFPDSIDPDGPNQVSSSTVDSLETLTIRDNSPVTAADKRFMKLLVTE
ncbi:chondroitinase-B domain-containing protein [Haloferula sp.]|uniref:chondroitinase-B domain-containing protein n=1 Tax=Haloferula sp. TaxID=2497595 RepID=UPI00329DA267